ncbi:hypothetical protein BLNAU_20948 [Blattamonas nauphoetae]|uniref:Uncharacterized protein n=1 Tax=Blattamonas nauphoetae TaxID=2049346 RepID=A0ABQ9WX83_9EUKA|nr:hypothetical protein BLNAU_20948 [Blattamonas nauphoetae]
MSGRRSGDSQRLLVLVPSPPSEKPSRRPCDCHVSFSRLRSITGRKRQRVEKGKSIESRKSGAHEDVTSLTRPVKQTEVSVDHAGTRQFIVVILPNCPTFSPTKLLNTIECRLMFIVVILPNCPKFSPTKLLKTIESCTTPPQSPSGERGTIEQAEHGVSESIATEDNEMAASTEQTKREEAASESAVSH